MIAAILNCCLDLDSKGAGGSNEKGAREELLNAASRGEEDHSVDDYLRKRMLGLAYGEAKAIDI